MSMGQYKFLDENINVNEKYENVFRKIYLKKLKSEEAVEEVIENAKAIFSKCINKDKGLINKTGIVIGKVQSGKTSNFIGLMSLGFDNAIDIVILIGGKDSKLLSQNEKRLNEVFNSNDSNRVKILEANKIYKDSDSYWKYLEQNNNNKLIITCLKNSRHLQNLFEFLADSKLTPKNIMIIDDEADQATLNSNAEIKKKTTPTILYQKITNILKILSHFVYVQVTATPYANLFLRSNDILRPQFVQLIYPGNSYMGLSDFHGVESNDYIRIIDSKELEQQISLGIDTIKLPSFERAFSTFLVGSYLKMQKEENRDSKSTMLIHTDRTIERQSIIANSMKELRSKLNSWSDLEETDFNFHRFLEFMNYGFVEYYKHKLDYFNNESDKKIIYEIKSILNSLDVVEVNRTNPLRNEEEISPLNHVVLIGADLIERGITIPNLLVAYNTRRSSGTTNADTILQRARWFGYREDFKEYIRIFCSKEIQDDYEKILIMDEELWFSLDDISENDELLKEWVKTLNLDKKNLRPTRKGVVNFEIETISTWHPQKELQNNKEIELDIYENLSHSAKSENYYKDVIHKIIEYNNVTEFENDFSNILEYILTYCDVSSDFWEYWRFNNKNMGVKVLLMHAGPSLEEKPYRTFVHGNQIQIFRGRGKKEKKGEYYLGDRKLNEYDQNKNLILVEIFKFDIYKKFDKSQKEKPIKTDAIFYAIHFPGKEVIRYVAKRD